MPSKLSCVQSESSKPTICPQTTLSSSLCRFFPGDDEGTEQQPVVEVSSPPVQQQYQSKGGPAVSSQAPTEKGVWPSPKHSEEVQLPKVSLQTEEVNSSHVESIQNGEDVMKEAPQSSPQATARDEGGMAPLVPVLSEKPRKSLVTAVSLPSEPSSVHSLSTPAPPPPLSTVPSSSIDEPPIVKLTHQGKSLSIYNILAQVGEGTFGKVYKACNSVTAALKQIQMETEKDWFPITAMWDIKLVQLLRHENVSQLYEMIVSNGKLDEKLCPNDY